MNKLPSAHKTIEQLWLEFSLATMPPQAQVIQHREMRRAFYAGFAMCLEHQTHELAELSDDEACACLDAWLTEFNEFKKAVKAQKA